MSEYICGDLLDLAGETYICAMRQGHGGAQHSGLRLVSWSPSVEWTSDDPSRRTNRQAVSDE